jgi:hypothetical protein
LSRELQATPAGTQESNGAVIALLALLTLLVLVHVFRG